MCVYGHKHTHAGMLLSHKTEWNCVINKTEGTGGHHVKLNKPCTKRQMLQFLPYIEV